MTLPVGEIVQGMRFAYADPPYLGCAMKFYSAHPDAAVYDSLDGHAALIARLVADYPDGWALSCASVNLTALLPLCPAGIRVMAWVKPFCAFKVNVGLAYAWEPVILFGGRRRTREQRTERDWYAEGITLRRGLTGAKPLGFCLWLLRCLNYQPGDTLDDLFPGTGIMEQATAMARRRCAQRGLFCTTEAQR